MTVIRIQTERGTVSLTQRQLDFVKIVTEGTVGYGFGHGSTQREVKRKIMEATGWDRKMGFCQMCCRFAYQNGIVKL